MKKALITIMTIIAFIAIQIFEKYILKTKILFGVELSILFLLMILFTTNYSDTHGLLIVFSLGFIRDSISSGFFGIYTISLILSYMAIKKITDNFYSQNVGLDIFKLSIIVSVLEIVRQIVNYIKYSEFLPYMQSIKIASVNWMVVSLILIIIYPIYRKIGETIESVYKKENIITKYFTV